MKLCLFSTRLDLLRAPTPTLRLYLVYHHLLRACSKHPSPQSLRQHINTVVTRLSIRANSSLLHTPHTVPTRRDPRPQPHPPPRHLACDHPLPLARCFPGTTIHCIPRGHLYPDEELFRGDQDFMADARSISTSSSGAKRKRTAPGYYAVKAGFETGLFYSWEDAKRQINGYKNAIFKKFGTLSEAEAFLADDTGVPKATAVTPKSAAKPTKYYGVQTGHAPGVYADYPSALEQVTGFRGGKQKSFATYGEALAYVNEGKQFTPSDAGDATSHRGPVGSSTPSVADARKPAKKQKRNDGSALAIAINGDYAPGTGPLPPDAEDGFDRTIKLNADGTISKKTEEELNARKMMPTGDFDGFIEVFTDGAAKGNGKIGSVGGIGVWFGPNDARNVSDPLLGERQTNQRAELTALKRALEIVPIDRPVRIFSDSNYAIKCVTEWYKKWETNGWKNAAGKDVDNKDIIKPIRILLGHRELCGAATEIFWVKGHDKNIGNIGADKLATDAAKRAQVFRDSNAAAFALALNGAQEAKDELERLF